MPLTRLNREPIARADADPADDPVVRFICDVLPHVPGGRKTYSTLSRHTPLIRKAARRKGLDVREIDGSYFFYQGRFPVGGMTGMLSSLTSYRAVNVCRSKTVTKEMLDAAGVPTPAGHVFDRSQVDLAVQSLAGRPVVLKPNVGAGGVGITCGIRTEAELRAAWDEAVQLADPTAAFLLEEHVVGLDVRVFVIGHTAVAAATRVPSHVVGDGVRDVRTLVADKQAVRDRNAYLSSKQTILDASFVERSGGAVTDVPSEGQVVMLADVSNVGRGGENVDVTDLLHPDLLSLAVDAVRAVPGLGVGGVDLMTPSLQSPEGAVVIELNTRANLGVHHYPTYGQPRDVAAMIVDRMLAVGSPAPQPSAPGRRRRGTRRARVSFMGEHSQP